MKTKLVKYRGPDLKYGALCERKSKQKGYNSLVFGFVCERIVSDFPIDFIN